MNFFLLILNVFLVRVTFFYSFLKSEKKKKIVKKSVPLRGKQSKLVKNMHFPKKSKKGVPLRGKCILFTNFDCFPRKGTLFLLF